MSQLIEVKVPDIGDFSAIPVIEICVKIGDTVAIDDALVTLESDKATMDVPSSVAGVVKEIKVAIDQRIGEGSIVAVIETTSAAASAEASAGASEAAPKAIIAEVSAPPIVAQAPAVTQTPVAALALGGITHASPSVRAFARGLGVDLHQVSASGPKGRILQDDVIALIKQVMSAGAASRTSASRTSTSPTTGSANLGGGLDLLPWPKIDFAKFGAVEMTPLSRIKKISGQNLARNWVMIPAVTYHEDADITDLEAFRVAMNKENEKSGMKMTMLAFIIKACEMGLKKFPEFNSSLDGDNLVLKKYFHIAFAADTPNGLVVPVIRNVDQKSVSELAAECGALAKKARDGKLAPADMSGACFTISSVGGIGGTAFSPIVNAPEVAILGVSKASIKPIWNGKEFVPRSILPLSLSADHRVIDGALATRFNAYIAALLGDMRRALV